MEILYRSGFQHVRSLKLGGLVKNDNSDSQDQQVVNPLAEPLPWTQELLKRIQLFGWWLSFHRGTTYEALLHDRIVLLGREVGFQDKWLKRILRHAISEFSKKGLGPDYYGYHNIDHELEAAYFTLLAASGQPSNRTQFSREEIAYLFVAALFHDYDPSKQFEKPHEDAVERIVRNDPKIVQFVKDVGLDINIVIALIYRTAYPFRGEIAEHATARMSELFDDAEIASDDSPARTRYTNMGWFLSISERVAGYALGDFNHARDLARKNASALEWHPSVINERSVQYFASLKEEREMLDKVLQGVAEEYSRTFFSNADAFRKAWEEELELKSLKTKMRLTAISEGNDAQFGDLTSESIQEGVRNAVVMIYKEEEPTLPLRVDDREFERSLLDPETILVTLRVYKEDNTDQIVGYAKGYPLEKSKQLRRGTADENFGKRNTVYLEPLCVSKGFQGSSGGHLLRLRFMGEASRRGYKFVTGYAERHVILQRAKKGEKMTIVQQYVPDMFDYYRADLADGLYQYLTDSLGHMSELKPEQQLFKI